MKNIFLGIFCLFFIPGISFAAIPSVYTNSNLMTSVHDKPVSLFFDGFGGFYGYTETGMLYTQKPIENIFGVKLHKFTIGQAYFYMSDKGLIAANDDIMAISIYFARA